MNVNYECTLCHWLTLRPHHGLLLLCPVVLFLFCEQTKFVFIFQPLYLQSLYLVSIWFLIIQVSATPSQRYPPIIIQANHTAAPPHDRLM